MDPFIYICFQRNSLFLKKGKTNYEALTSFFRQFTGEKNLKIIKEKNNNPKIISQNSLFFSISHKKNNFLMAFSYYLPIGVDLEINRKKNIMSLTKRFFHEKEYEFIKKTKNAQEKFYDFWTIKEAIYKLQSSKSKDNFFTILRQDIITLKKDLFIKKLFLGRNFFAHLVSPKKSYSEKKIAIHYLS